MQFEFCLQNRTALGTGSLGEPVLAWPAGQYCIHSVGRVVRAQNGYEWVLGDCPAGFKPGELSPIPLHLSPTHRPLTPIPKHPCLPIFHTNTHHAFT